MILKRLCKSCKQVKRTTEFYKLRRDSTCKACWRAREKARYVPKAKRRGPPEKPERQTVLPQLQAWCVRP